MSSQSPDPVTSGPPRRGRYLPAFLDAILPGLGHLVAGRRKLALIFGLPIIVLALAAILVLLTTNTVRLGVELLDPNIIAALIAVQAFLLVWRLIAVGSSLTDPRLPKPGVRDALPIVALVAVVVLAPQVYAGAATQAWSEFSDSAFVEESPAPTPSGPLPTPEPDASFLVPAPSASASPSPTPTPTVPRVNVLLVGVDSASNRNTYLTDTMIVASLDPVGKTVSMLSIPRDMVDVPLADGRKFSAKINGLVSYARRHKRQFPGSDGKGFDVLREALGTLLKIDIKYHAVVNLDGFVRVVDKLGGINVNVVRAFCDPTNHGHGYRNGFSITKGRHHLNGAAALAYARARKAAGESDFSRAARQQEVLTGIRDKLVSGGFVNDPIGLLKALRGTMTTNVPRKILPDLAETMTEIGRGSTYRSVITRPMVRGTLDSRGSVQIPNLRLIRKRAGQLFTEAGVRPEERFRAPKKQEGKPTRGGISSCGSNTKPKPKPAPKATPKPTKKPKATPKPTPKATPEPTPEATPEPTPEPTPEEEPPPEP